MTAVDQQRRRRLDHGDRQARGPKALGDDPRSRQQNLNGPAALLERRRQQLDLPLGAPVRVGVGEEQRHASRLAPASGSLAQRISIMKGHAVETPGVARSLSGWPA